LAEATKRAIEVIDVQAKEPDAIDHIQR
jgi:hypothetical protein